MPEGHLQKEPMSWFFLTTSVFKCRIFELNPGGTVTQTAGENLASGVKRHVSDCTCPAVDPLYMLVLRGSVSLGGDVPEVHNLSNTAQGRFSQCLAAPVHCPLLPVKALCT